MPEAAILVVSCDAYSDLWRPFFQLFRRHWPDCPFPVFLGSNHQMCPESGVTSICVGEDVSWADNLRRMLDQVPFPRIILFLEDFLLVRQVDTARIRSLVKMASDEQPACLRLYPHPPPSRQVRRKPGVGEIRRGDDYRVSTQVAVWDVKVLKALAWSGFSAWNFEIIGSLASNEMDAKFWSVYEPALDYRNGVWRGRWLPEGLDICSETRVDVDLGVRGVLNSEELEHSQIGLRGIVRALLPDSLSHYRRRMLRLWRGRAYMRQLLQEAGLPKHSRHLDSAIANMRLCASNREPRSK